MEDLSSFAESKAKECLRYGFCKSLNLENIKEKLSSILNHIGDNGMFAEYTMHDISHVNGMLRLLDKIIPGDTKGIMTPADWLMTVLSIYFHDLGMFISTKEYNNRQSNNSFALYKEQAFLCHDVKEYVESLEDDQRERFLYQEFVRKNHGDRIFEWISSCDSIKDEPCQLISEMLTGLDSSFRSDLALVCKSHQMDTLPERLMSVDEAYGSSDEEKVNLLYVSVLLRSADILHMTYERTPDVEYRIILPQNRISEIEWAKQKAVKSVDIHYEQDEHGALNKDLPVHSFEIQAKFTDDKGYFSFKSFIDYVVLELKNCHKWCENSRQKYSNQYYFPWTGIDTSRVQAEGFLNKKLRFEIDQKSILNLLTGHTLYNDSTVVLRELIQNAMDAGRLQDSRSKISSKYQCKIEICWDSINRILRVADNATGMDQETITNYLLRVGSSKYQSDSFKKDYPDFHSISRFGIGLLTCFMISDDVDIYTLDEEEKQCHLLKIRNLNGEYLMRNDADSSHILDGAHGTTFELKVRPGISMDNIEQQIKQWVILPFGKITLSIDGGTSSIVGYGNVKEAIEDYVSTINGVDLDSGRYKVHFASHDGVDLAFLQRYNPIMKVWSIHSFYESDNIADAPIGISVEGIKVTSYSPGIRTRNYLALANCYGKNSPTTNVARNDLEGGFLLEKLYQSIYEIYIESYISQINELCKTYSLSWAAAEVNHLIDNFYELRPFGRFNNREVFLNVLRNAECIPIDSGKDIRLVSINSLPNQVTTIVSRAFTSAVSLLKDMNIAGKTAYGLMSELENHDVKDEFILLSDSIAKCIFNLFLDDYEVSTIDVDEKCRKIKFTWTKNTGRWTHIKTIRTRTSLHLFVLMEDANVKIGEMCGKNTILTGRCIYLVENSPLLSFIRQAIIDLQVNENVLDIICNLVYRLLSEDDLMDEQAIDNYLNSDENYLKNELFEKFTQKDLKDALLGCRNKVVNFDKYYRVHYYDNRVHFEDF